MVTIVIALRKLIYKGLITVVTSRVGFSLIKELFNYVHPIIEFSRDISVNKLQS